MSQSITVNVFAPHERGDSPATYAASFEVEDDILIGDLLFRAYNAIGYPQRAGYDHVFLVDPNSYEIDAFMYDFLNRQLLDSGLDLSYGRIEIYPNIEDQNLRTGPSRRYFQLGNFATSTGNRRLALQMYNIERVSQLFDDNSDNMLRLVHEASAYNNEYGRRLMDTVFSFPIKVPVATVELLHLNDSAPNIYYDPWNLHVDHPFYRTQLF